MRTAAIAVAATSAVAVRKRWSGRPADGPAVAPAIRTAGAVTINRPIEEIGSDIPAPLAEFGEAVEVRLTPAPDHSNIATWDPQSLTWEAAE